MYELLSIWSIPTFPASSPEEDPMTTTLRHPIPMPDSSVRLLPASQFTIEELTSAYNLTRVDYLVPMPMNAARLAAYVNVYNVDMERSWVAVDDSQMLGLAMLGV